MVSKSRKLLVKNELPIILIGIVSSESDLKLSWGINKIINIRLARTENVSLIVSGHKLEFPLYQYSNESENLNYFLLQNRYAHNFYFDELKNIDYLLLVRGNDSEFKSSELVLKLRSLDGINSVLVVPQSSIKKKDKFDIF
jgi:hypothetical protein